MFPESIYFWEIKNKYNNLASITLKIVHFCTYTLLSAIVKVLETYYKPFRENLFSSSVAFLILSVEPQKHYPLNADFIRGNR